MSVRYPGRAEIDAFAPEAIGICDRCGFQYNLRSLRWQFGWAGEQLINLQLLVCERCLDVPNEQLRTFRIPADPDPVFNARVENFAEDEKNYLNLKQPPNGKPSMFPAFCGMTAALDVRKSHLLVADLSATSAMTTVLQVDLRMAPALSAVSAMSAALARAITMSATLTAADGMAATLTQVAPVVRSATNNYNFSASGSHSQAAVPIGSAATDRLVFVSVVGINSTASDGIDSMTIGGIAATMAAEIITVVGASNAFSSIWWAAVPTGTTGTIALTFTGDTINGSVAAYKVTGADTVAPINSSNTATVASGAVAASVTPPAMGGSIACAWMGLSTGDPDITWTNATEDYDVALNLGGFFGDMGFASRQDVASPGSISISANATTDLSTVKNIAMVTIKVP